MFTVLVGSAAAAAAVLCCLGAIITGRGAAAAAAGRGAIARRGTGLETAGGAAAATGSPGVRVLTPLLVILTKSILNSGPGSGISIKSTGPDVLRYFAGLKAGVSLDEAPGPAPAGAGGLAADEAGVPDAAGVGLAEDEAGGPDAAGAGLAEGGAGGPAEGGAGGPAEGGAGGPAAPDVGLAADDGGAAGVDEARLKKAVYLDTLKSSSARPVTTVVVTGI